MNPRKPAHRCSDVGDQPIIPTKLPYRQHQRERTPPCAYASACLSAYTYHRKHGTTTGWPGWKPRGVHIPNHICSNDTSLDNITASNAAYSEHQRLGTAACPASKASAALGRWLARHPGQVASDWYYRRKADHSNGYYLHDCRSTNYTPSNNAWLEHRRQGTDQCVFARRCAALRQWSKLNPHKPLSDWPNRAAQIRPPRHHCQSVAPLRVVPATHALLNDHKREGTKPCWLAKAASGRLLWARSHPDLPPGDWPGYKPHRREQTSTKPRSKPKASRASTTPAAKAAPGTPAEKPPSTSPAAPDNPSDTPPSTVAKPLSTPDTSPPKAASATPSTGNTPTTTSEQPPASTFTPLPAPSAPAPSNGHTPTARSNGAPPSGQMSAALSLGARWRDPDFQAKLAAKIAEKRGLEPANP